MPRKREYTTKDIEALLGESMVWPDGLEPMNPYRRLHDDHDGTQEGEIVVTIGPDGDGWIRTRGQRPMESLRFRTLTGGGSSPRVRNALLILAYAIKLEEGEDRVKK